MDGRPNALSTGFSNLDRALGGGFPRGQIVEIFGPANVGKTALALQSIASLQKGGGAGAWIDAEHAFDAEFARKLGVNLEQFAVAEPDSAERAFAMTRRLVASGAVDLVVVDSAAALIPALELEMSLAGEAGGLHSRLLGSELRRLAPAAVRSQAVVIFLNQIRTRLDAGPGEPETSAGGPSLKLFASVRIALAAAGRTVRFRVVKNRFGPVFQSGELEWHPGQGFTERL